jgi:hypothetical protein
MTTLFYFFLFVLFFRYANITHRPTSRKWVIPWVEDDPGLTAPELWLNRTLMHAQSANAYGVGGLLTIHWRTRAVSPQVAAAHAIAWNISLQSVDAWQTWALGQFGDPTISAQIAAIFISIDSFSLPRPVDWINGPGGMQPSSSMCNLNSYGFVDTMVQLRPALLDAIAAGTSTLEALERFDYWAGQFIYMRSIAIYECNWYYYNAIIATIKAIPDPNARQNAARTQGIPARILLQANATNVVQNLLATVSTVEGLGTTYNILSRGIYSGVGPTPTLELVNLAGETLPANALPPSGWDITRPPQARVPTMRSMLAAGEPLRLKAFVLCAAYQAPTSVIVYTSPHGTSTWTPNTMTQAPSAAGVTRYVYTIEIASPPATGIDWYLEV